MCLAVPGKIMAIDPDPAGFPTGRVEFGGVTREVSLACTPEAKIGDYVLVHAGLALSVVDEEEAKLTFQYLAEIEALEG